jgi:hypothetical protein
MAPVQIAEASLSPPPGVDAGVEVLLHDTLASDRRLWVRGRLVLPPIRAHSTGRSWWKRWRHTPPPAPDTVEVQTQVGGETLTATVPLNPDGEFEASFEVDLPAARRGWRVARHQITHDGRALRACSVVLVPPADATAALVVVLPLDFTSGPGGAERLTHSPLAGRLTELFARLQEPHRSPWPVYYLCAVPPDAPNLQPELALAATSLGWPAGHFVLLPGSADRAGEALAAALDRLRWLLADRLELVVVNREPTAEANLAEAVAPRPDRATIRRFLGPAAVVEPVVERAGEGGTVAVAWRGPRPTRLRCVPRHPVVFCHGMLAMTMLRMQIPEDTNYFFHLRPFLRERGVQALFPNVEPTGGVAARAEQLRDQIVRWTDEPINIVAHSMGGLDARHLITRLGLASRVRSLTTIATPHRGSSLADWFCLHFRDRVPLLLTLEALGIDVDGFRDCRTDVCRAFNEQTPDVPEVRYFSYTAAAPASRVSPLLRRAWAIVTAREGDNDGLVSIRSARWGTHLGTLAVDHFAQTPDGLFVRPGENFDALGFYLRLIEELAHRGL